MPARFLSQGARLLSKLSLQRSPTKIGYSLIVEQGRADITGRRGSGAHALPSDPGWTASPICSGLICGRHKDLYYRLNVVPIELQPLRKRTADIPPLAEHFLAWASSPRKQLSDEAKNSD
jgi:hypothetical protein